MERKRICFIAQFPPPIHGLSMAVETLFNAPPTDEFEFEKIDITDNKNIFKNLYILLKNKSDLFYFTISQTKWGNIRDLIILILLQIQHKKCLVHLHGGYYRTMIDKDLGSLQKRANYKIVSRLHGAIVLGSSLKYIFEGILPENKIYTVSNCVDNQYLMDNTEYQQKLNIIDQKPILHILYLSNFIHTKGYGEVLKLAKIEKKQFELNKKRRFHFDFAGKFFEKSEERNFNQYIKDNGLEKFITYHGVVTGNQKRWLLKNCDIFILLTRYPKEGQPISILEAMGNGLAIVTTDHAGIPDIVKNGVNGIVVNKDQIEIELIYMALNTLEIKSISYDNRNLILNFYQQNQYISNMYSVFRELTNQT